MNCGKLAHTVHSTALATLSIMFLASQVLTSLTVSGVSFVSGGHVLKYPQLAVLQLNMHEFNFDQKGFSVLEVNVLLDYLSHKSNAVQMNGFAESDVAKYSLLLRFADCLKSESLFNFVARDFYFLLGISVFEFSDRIPEIRTETFERILFKVYLDLACGSLSLEERVTLFFYLTDHTRPHLNAFQEFFSKVKYKVLQVRAQGRDRKITEWTVEVEAQFQTSFFIGNYDSEEWHLKFVDGNLHFELAKFLVTNADCIGYSHLATLFLALARRDTITAQERNTAIRIAFDFELADAVMALKQIGRHSPNKPNKPDSKNDEIPFVLSNRIRKRTDGNKKQGHEKKRRIECTTESASVYFTNVKQFRFVVSNRTGYLSFRKAQSRLFIHLKKNLGSVLRAQKRRMEFRFDPAVKTKNIKFPDLSYEAVKSFLEVDQRGLLNGAPPCTADYELAKEIPDNEEKQKNLMIQVAQMVCVAIRLKFDEGKFFTLLDWYKERMNGVWEELVQSGNKFVREVEEVKADWLQTVQDSVVRKKVQEEPFDDETSPQNAIYSVKVFRIVFETSSFVTARSGLFFRHLQETFWKLKFQKGKLEFFLKKGEAIQRIKLPGVSWEAIKSYVEVTKGELSDNNGPPLTISYILAKMIPENEEEQKELMVQVAQMVCVAIRFKFDEVKLFSLLDWYKAGMEGVWEQLLQSESGNECAREVEEFRASITVAQIGSADDHSFI